MRALGKILQDWCQHSAPQQLLCLWLGPYCPAWSAGSSGTGSLEGAGADVSSGTHSPGLGPSLPMGWDELCRTRGTPVCETSVGRTAVLWDLLLLLQTGIGAGNTDNFIYLLLTQ